MTILPIFVLALPRRCADICVVNSGEAPRERHTSAKQSYKVIGTSIASVYRREVYAEGETTMDQLESLNRKSKKEDVRKTEG